MPKSRSLHCVARPPKCGGEEKARDSVRDDSARRWFKTRSNGCPVPKNGTGRYKFKSNVKDNIKDNGKDARLKRQKQAAATNSTATSSSKATSTATSGAGRG
jgi:hypothetical protein